MSTESNRQLIDDFYTALGAGDEDMARFFAADVEWHLPRSSPMYGSLTGREAVLGLFGAGTVSDFYRPETLQFDYLETLTVGDNVIKPFTLRAVTVNGQNYENDYMMRFRIEDGRIAEVWEYFDTATLFNLVKPG